MIYKIKIISLGVISYNNVLYIEKLIYNRLYLFIFEIYLYFYIQI